MKKLSIFLQLTLLLSFTAFSQTGNSFKNVSKKQSGTTLTNLPYKTVSNRSNLKSSVSNNSNASFNVSNNLKQPNLNNDSLKNFQYLQGIPIFFEKDRTKQKSAKNETIEEQFYSFHEQAKQKTKLSNPKQELIIINQDSDELGITHVKSQQYFKDVKVYGAESYLHIGSQKDIFTGYIYPIDDNLDVNPSLSKESVIRIVESDLNSKTIVKSLSAREKEFLEYKSPDAELVIFENILAYEVCIRPNFIEEWKYFVNAQNGNVLHYFNNTKSDGPTTATAYDLNNVLRTIDVYFESGKYYLADFSQEMYNATNQEGVIFTYDANNTDMANVSIASSPNNTWNNRAAISAHSNASVAYKYFRKTFNRNSINNKGGNIIAIVNLSDEMGNGFDNAYWNGKYIAFGNGGEYFKNLAGGLDVVAHELGHGVIQNTANLEYYGQSGAINETFADIFGAMVDRDDWLIGEDITKSSYSPSGTMRDMSDPHNKGNSLNDSYWQPNHLSEMYIGENDDGGVHTNSGIGNYAYYLYATAITKEKAEQVFYRALVNYLTSKSQFIDLRIAVVQSAKDLYGDNSSEVIEAVNAFEAVGIYEENSIDYAQDYPVNPGQDYLLSYDTDLSNSKTLFRSSTKGTNFYGLSSTVMKGSVSVSDDGSGAVFVASDDKIKVISIDPSNIQEFYLSDEAFFENVAISKDGNRLAAISTEADTAIYVYDFVSQKWSKFNLYNPTTSHVGTNAGGVVFADAIEFDHTGEYLMYDSYNVLNSSLGDDISYWDIGFIKIWDNSKNDFGDGTITKLYGSLPENVSIGNATFSKNSPYIIAFDYMNSWTDEYAIIGANLLTGDVDVITTNATLGFPSFSKNDDKIAFSALNTINEDVIAVINVATNKISGAGSASIIVENAKWPVFYAGGSRSLNLKPVANFTVDIKSGVAPLSVQFIDLSINNPVSWSWVFKGGTPSTSNQQNPTVKYNSSGIYQVSLTCKNSAGNNTITKTSYISVSQSTSIDEKANEIFSFYPNPTDGILFIKSNKEFRVKIYSMSGILLIDETNNKEIDLSNYSNGLYIMQIETDGKVLTDKIVKQ